SIFLGPLTNKNGHIREYVAIFVGSFVSTGITFYHLSMLRKNILCSFWQCCSVESLWDTLPNRLRYWYSFQTLPHPFGQPFFLPFPCALPFPGEGGPTEKSWPIQKAWQKHFYRPLHRLHRRYRWLN